MRRYHETFRLWEYLLFTLVTLAVLCLCVCVGSVRIPLSDTLSYFAAKLTGDALPAGLVSSILPIRLPRVLCVALTGTALSLAGAAMQGLLKNPLADGSTLGVSSGASLGAVIAIAFGVTLPSLPFAGTMGTAIIFAFASLLVILGLSYKLDRSLSTNTIILIGVIAAYINYTNRAKNETTSAVGVICGAFAVAGATIYNVFYLPVYNVIADLINFLGNVFQHPIASIEILFLQLSQYVVGVIRGMVRTIEKLINLIPGVKINITSGLDTFYDSYTDSIQKIKDQSGWTEYVKHKEKIEYSTAYANGYNWGANLQNSISEKLGLDLPDDPATGLLSNIADNTAQIADDVSVSSDDIKLLRDIAERQVINKYTTAEIKVEMVNHNNISNEMDLDGVVNLLEAKVTEALVTSAEGVHI